MHASDEKKSPPTDPAPVYSDVPLDNDNDNDKAPTHVPKLPLPSSDQPPQRSTFRNIVIIGTLTLAMILNTSNLTAVFISLPTIGQDLNIAENKLQWIVSSFALSSGCLLLFLGRIADIYGRKITFIAGCVVMSVFGLACGFAKNEITIDILRALQGLGPAASIPAALGIIANTFPPSPLRSVAFATFAAGAPVGAAIGSAVGGVLTQLTAQSWRSTFWFLSGVSAMCAVGAIYSIDWDVSHVQDKRVDWLGAFLVTAGLTFIVFVLSEGPIAPQGWKTPWIIALLIVGVILLGFFVLWQDFLEKIANERLRIKEVRERIDAEQSINPEAYATSKAQAEVDMLLRPRLRTDRWWTPDPLMRVSLWKKARGKLAVMFIIAFLEWCSFSAFTFWVQLYYQDYLRLNPILTMVRLLPMSVTGIICNALVALLVGRIDMVILIASGTLLTGISSLLFAVIVESAPYWAFGFPAAIITVFGADFVFATGTIFVASVCSEGEQSVGGALFQTLTQLGTAFGLSITTIAYNAALSSGSRNLGVVLNTEGTNAPRPAQFSAYKAAMWGGFAFGVLGSAFAVIFLRGVGIIGHRGGAHGEPPAPDASSEKTMRDPDEAAERGVADITETSRSEH